jgi:hypothetical protein
MTNPGDTKEAAAARGAAPDRCGLGIFSAEPGEDGDAAAQGSRRQSPIISATALWRATHPEDAMRDRRSAVVLLVPGYPHPHLQAAFDASL